MDGFQATAAIREKERITGWHLPIVAMTAHAMKGIATLRSRQEWTVMSQNPSRSRIV